MKMFHGSLVAFVSACGCLCKPFCFLFGTSSGINTNVVRTSAPYGDQSPVLMRLVKVRAVARCELKLG